MKELWTALALLAALIAALAFLGRAVDGLAAPLSADLTRAAAAARAGNWETARELTDRAASSWELADGWLRLVESHQTVGDVAALLDEARVYVRAREEAPFRAAACRAVRALTVLRTAERVSWGNVF